MKKILREPLLYLLPLLAALYLIVIPAKMEISDVKIMRNGKTENIQLPYSIEMESGEIFFISYNLLVKDKKTAKFKVIPDDCIQEILINGEKFPLDNIKGLCDYSKGVYLDFSKYVQEGLNHFEFRIINSGAPGGLRVETPYNGFKSLSLKHYGFALFFLLIVSLILRKFKFKYRVILIILLGIFVRLVVYTYTGPMQNPYDVGAHLHYIQIISEEKRIPKSDEGWSTFHPPLYYVASAVIKTITDSYDPTLTSRILQQESLLISFVSVVLAVALIINLFGNCWMAYLAALVSVLWPGFVLAAPRIGNEGLFYFGALFCMLFVQRYWRLHKNSDILLASIGASIALAAKTTGYVILGVWVIIYIFGTIRYLKFGSLKTLLVSAFIVALFVGFSNYRTVVDVFEGKKYELVGNSSGLNGNLRVNNLAGNYLYFDLEDYLLNPYTSPWTDKGGRQYYWNYALKTSLFGEFRSLNSPIGYTTATILSTLALFIFILALWGIIHAKSKDLPSLFFMVFLFAAHIYLRIISPYSCSNDFRYIFPVLFPLVYFATRGVQILENSRLRKLSYAGMLAFAALSFAFIVGQAI
jgi:4-amino-4-deoxy-L-arabinose transferase and related glycosyltransferases of PMT family